MQELKPLIIKAIFFITMYNLEKQYPDFILLLLNSLFLFPAIIPTTLFTSLDIVGQDYFFHPNLPVGYTTVTLYLFLIYLNRQILPGFFAAAVYLVPLIIIQLYDPSLKIVRRMPFLLSSHRSCCPEFIGDWQTQR